MSGPIRRIPPRFNGPPSQRRIGIIAPFDMALERELWRWTPPEVSLHVTRTPYNALPVNAAMAKQAGNRLDLQEAARDIIHVEPEVVAFLCTSASFIDGIRYEQMLCHAILAAGARGAVTASGALADALLAVGANSVSLVTPYVSELSEQLEAYLSEIGVRVIASRNLGLQGDIWKVGYDTIAESIIDIDNPASDAIVVSCTNLPTYDLIEPLENFLGKPIITANQATLWACLDQMGMPRCGTGLWLHRNRSTYRDNRAANLWSSSQRSQIQRDDLADKFGDTHLKATKFSSDDRETV